MAKSSDLASDQVAIETVSRRSRVTVTITTSGDERVLEFDRQFLRSGEELVTHFATEQGAHYRIFHRGERDCDADEDVSKLRIIRGAAVQRRVEAEAV